LRTAKKLLIRGADKYILKNDNKSAYDLALESNNFEMAKLLKPKNCFQKYLCQDSDIEEFKPSRNDLYLLLYYLFYLLFLLIYIFKIAAIIKNPEDFQLKKISNETSYSNNYNDNLIQINYNMNNSNFTYNNSYSIFDARKFFQINKNITDYNLTLNFTTLGDCIFDENCTFEIIISLNSLLVDLVTITIIIYFMCCMGSASTVKSKNNKKINRHTTLIVYFF